MSSTGARTTAPPGALALAGWTIRREGEEIVTGGVRMHWTAARDLAMRLLDVVEDGDREAERDAWRRLEEHLDATFLHAGTAVGTQISRGSARVPGRIFRTGAKTATLRVATFSVVRLHPVERVRRGRPWTPWEGPVRELRPTSTGWDERLLDLRVRVEDATVRAAPLADPDLGRPVPRLQVVAAPERRLATFSPTPPAPSDHIARRRWEVAASRAVLLSALDTGAATDAELAAAVGARTATVRDLLRGMLEDGLVVRKKRRWSLARRKACPQ